MPVNMPCIVSEMMLLFKNRTQCLGKINGIVIFRMNETNKRQTRKIFICHFFYCPCGLTCITPTPKFANKSPLNFWLRINRII